MVRAGPREADPGTDEEPGKAGQAEQDDSGRIAVTLRMAAERTSSRRLAPTDLRMPSAVEPGRDLSIKDIPPELEAAIMTCLARDPDHRPSSALELRDRLRRCRFRRPWGVEEQKAWWQPIPRLSAEPPARDSPLTVTLTERAAPRP